MINLWHIITRTFWNFIYYFEDRRTAKRYDRLMRPSSEDLEFLKRITARELDNNKEV